MDIVKRLRGYEDGDLVLIEDVNEAADEIERLRAENAKLEKEVVEWKLTAEEECNATLEATNEIERLRKDAKDHLSVAKELEGKTNGTP